MQYLGYRMYGVSESDRGSGIPEAALVDLERSAPIVDALRRGKEEATAEKARHQAAVEIAIQ